MMSGLLVLAVPGVPVLAGMLLLLLGRRVERRAGAVAVLAAAVAAGLSLWLWQPRLSLALDWFPLDGRMLALTLGSEGPAALLTSACAVLTLLVLTHAWERPRYACGSRFFGLLSLFHGGLLWVVLAQDPLTLMLGWELMGLCSYALVGFRYQLPEGAGSATRVLVSGKATDLGLYLAVLAAWSAAPGAGFDQLPALPSRDWIAAGLLLAALGRSAQWPFHGWLRPAMAGPAPAGALLHTSLLLGAGVVLLIKAQPLLDAVAWSRPLLMGLAVISILAGSAIALYQDQLKPLLAAASLAQFGYLYAGLAAGVVPVVVAFLLSHGTAMAVLFLQLGMALALGQRPARRKQMPLVIGLLGLAGLPPAAAFLTKQHLLEAVQASSGLAGVILLLGVFLTGACAGRAWRLFRAFPAAPLSLPTTFADWVLAALVILLGLPVLTPFAEPFAAVLGVEPRPHISVTWSLGSLAAALLGAWWGTQPTRLARGEPAGVFMAEWLGGLGLFARAAAAARRVAGLLGRLEGRDRLDRLGRLACTSAQRLARFDQAVLGQGVWQGGGRLGSAPARGVQRLERRVGQLMTGWASRGFASLGRGIAGLLDGRLPRYFGLLVAGVAVLLVYALIVLGEK